MSITWIEVNGKRVAPVRGEDRACGTKRTGAGTSTRVECPFYDGWCTAPGAVSSNQPCAKYGSDIFFITEDQLPEYLAANLLGEVE